MSDSIEERLDALEQREQRLDALEQREQRLDAIDESIEEITKQLTAHNNRMDALSRMANSNKDYVDDAQRTPERRSPEQCITD
jgi:chromosome segregation ATPase